MQAFDLEFWCCLKTGAASSRSISTGSRAVCSRSSDHDGRSGTPRGLYDVPHKAGAHILSLCQADVGALFPLPSSHGCFEIQCARPWSLVLRDHVIKWRVGGVISGVAENIFVIIAVFRAWILWQKMSYHSQFWSHQVICLYPTLLQMCCGQCIQF